MKSRQKKASLISLALAVALAAVLLVLAFRGVDWSAMASRLRQARLDLLALAFCTLTISCFIRGLRWRILLSAERLVSPITAFWGTGAGYLGNNFLPARAGEVIRSALIARKTGISISYVLATALVERVLDVGALVLISSGAIAALGAAPVWLVTATRVMSALALAGIAAFFVIPRIHLWIERLLARLVVRETLRNWLLRLLAQAVLGLRAVQSLRRASGFAGLTVVIWLMDALSLMIVARAFALTLALPQALLLLAALGLSSAAPSTPGYVGIYQFVAVTVLAPFGISKAEALAFIIGSQAVMYAVFIVWGLLGLWNLGVQHMPAPATSEEVAAGGPFR
jgi:glycosyltransferase 2 family protein